MYRIVYDKQAVKDIKNLKSARLDDKAKKADRGHPGNPFFKIHHPMKRWLEICREFIREESIFSTGWFIRVYSEPVEWKGMRYDGTVKIIRMWTHYDGVC